MHLSIFDFYKSAQAWEVLRLAIRFDFFRAFSEKEKVYSLGEISQELELPEPICKSFLHIFETVDVIRSIENRYQLNTTYFETLNPESRSYLGHRVNQMEAEVSFLRAASLEELKKNFNDKLFSSDVSDREIETRHRDFLINDGEFLSASASGSAKQFLDHYRIPDGKTLLDLGGNDGSFLIPIVLSNPTLNGIVLDLARLQDRAEKNISNARLQNRIKFHSQNFFDGEFPGAD